MFQSIAFYSALFIIVIYYCNRYSFISSHNATHSIIITVISGHWTSQSGKKPITEMFQLSQLLSSTLLIFIRDKSNISVIAFWDDYDSGVERSSVSHNDNDLHTDVMHNINSVCQAICLSQTLQNTQRPDRAIHLSFVTLNIIRTCSHTESTQRLT